MTACRVYVKMQGTGVEPLEIKVGLIFSCFNNSVNSYRVKYLRGEGDSDSYLLTNLMVSYLLNGHLPEFYSPESDRHNYPDCNDNNAKDSLHPFTRRYIFISNFTTNTTCNGTQWNYWNAMTKTKNK